jgi:acyl-CoA synthetase (AMP-forming)/AMP-acid ligase II
VRGDLEWGTIPRLLDIAAERFGAREAIVDGETRLSFEQLRAAARQGARATIASGVNAGDRVAIWAPNIHEWIVAALGALTAGAVLVPINTRFKGREAGYVLEKSRARLLFTVRGFIDIDYPAMLRDADIDTRAIDIVLLRGEAEGDTMPWATFARRADEMEDEILEKRSLAIAPEDLSDIIFTSGTTGQPKGVMTTHAQSLRVFEVWSRIVGLTEGDRYLIVNPFFHTFGYKAGVLASLMRGATIVPHAVFDAGQVMRRIGEERITVLPGPPTLYQSILNDPARAEHDLSSLRLAVTGAAVVPVELIKRMRDELTFETILTAYGLTESTGTATMCRPEDDAETIANTSGRAIPDTEVKVVDDDGQEAARGEPGEIVVRGYNVTQGYFEDPEQTAATIKDGWLHTGDIGVMDARGYIRITDRKKDMFIVGGFNAYPAEIENELLRHPDIAQVAVVGAPDDRMGEVGIAFVVARPGVAIDPTLIISWAKSQLANYKVPRHVEIVDALPMNASGKVLKYELRERARTMMEER